MNNETEKTCDFADEWNFCRYKKIRAEVGYDGEIRHVWTGRKIVVDPDEITAFLAKHPKFREAIAEFKTRRAAAVAEWCVKTPSIQYRCDRGGLLVAANGVKMLVGNGYGDGEFRVFFCKVDFPSFRPFPACFQSVCVTLENAKVEVYDYDCHGGKIIKSINANCVDFYRHGGNMIVAFEEAL